MGSRRNICADRPVRSLFYGGHVQGQDVMWFSRLNAVKHSDHYSAVWMEACSALYSWPVLASGRQYISSSDQWRNQERAPTMGATASLTLVVNANFCSKTGKLCIRRYTHVKSFSCPKMRLRGEPRLGTLKGQTSSWLGGGIESPSHLHNYSNWNLQRLRLRHAEFQYSACCKYPFWRREFTGTIEVVNTHNL